MEKRVLLKISGEALRGSSNSIIDANLLEEIAQNIRKYQQMGLEIGIVFGGGNIWRGGNNQDIDFVISDQAGMLATVINALLFSEILKTHGVRNTVFNAVEIGGMVPKFNKKDAVSKLEEGEVLIFSGGTGNPGFSTDTAAALYAAQIHAELLVKYTNVDGVYEEDPKINSNASLYKQLDYQTFLQKDFKVMDNTAICLCQNYNLPIVILNIKELSSLLEVLEENNSGTMICSL